MFKELFKKMRKKEEVEEVEIPAEEPGKQVTVRIENLTGMIDVDRIGRLVKDGNILFLKTKELRRKDIGQFQNTVLKLKRVCTQFGWDIVGTEDGYLIVTPPFAKIVR
jgi:SepF-like predicted cell division protein (DUF552 family)